MGAKEFWEEFEKAHGGRRVYSDPHEYYERLSREMLIQRPEIMLGYTLAEQVPAGIRLDELAAHVHIMAATGMGKSRLLIQLFNELRKQDASIILLDAAKGDTFRLALDYVVQDEARSWVFSPHAERNQGYIPFYNPLHAPTAVSLDGIAVAWEDEDFWNKPWVSGYLELIFKTLAVLGRPLTDLERLLDVETRWELLVELPEGDLKEQWQSLSQFRPDEQLNILQAASHRIRRFLANPYIKQIVTGQPSFPLREVFDQPEILLLDGSVGKQLLKHETRLLTALVLNHLLHLAQTRDNPDHPVYIILDEFGHLANAELIGTLLDLGRGLNVRLILAHHHLDQLTVHSPKLGESVLVNARAKFMMGGTAQSDWKRVRSVSGADVGERAPRLDRGQALFLRTDQTAEGLEVAHVPDPDVSADDREGYLEALFQSHPFYAKLEEE